ncbi:MAG: hypothetical protein R6V62_04905 [Candidatus Fermentibacteraceae bacterium]
MRALIVSAILLLCLAHTAAAAFEELELGTECRAMGGTGVVTPGIAGMLWNPAAVSFETHAKAMAAGRMPYGNSDFVTAGADIALPLSRGWVVGGGARLFGGDLYSEQMVHVTASRLLTDDFSVGIQPLFCRASISDGVSSYGSSWTADMTVGLQARVFDRWSVGAALRNPFEARIGESGEHLVSRMDIGVRYEPLPGMASAFAVSRDFQSTAVRVGQALPLGPLTLFAGVRSGPAVVTGGLSADVSGVLFSYAVETHPQLNATHQAGVGYAF